MGHCLLKSSFRLNQRRINAIPAHASLVPYSSVLLRCFFCNLFALNFYPNTSEDKFWNLSISWFSFSGQLEPTIFNYSLAFCLFLMGESCVSLNMYIYNQSFRSFRSCLLFHCCGCFAARGGIRRKIVLVSNACPPEKSYQCSLLPGT